MFTCVAVAVLLFAQKQRKQHLLWRDFSGEERHYCRFRNVWLNLALFSQKAFVLDAPFCK